MEPSKIFTVTPMSQRVTLDPGQTYDGSLTVINPVNATEDFNYKIYVAPYGVVDAEDGVDLVSETSYTQIKDWITLDQTTGTLKPNQVAEVPYHITVPADASAGGQYAAIVVSRDEQMDSDDSTVSVKDIFEVASLIYGEVTGDTTRGGEIVENTIPSFVAAAPITLSATVTNTGNIHDNATIIIKATDVFSGKVIVGDDANTSTFSEIVMPESTRHIERNIMDGLPMLGIVHVEQKIAWNGQVSEEARDVIICPAWFIIAAGAVLGLIIGLVIRIVRRHHKKRLQKKAKKQAAQAAQATAQKSETQ